MIKKRMMVHVVVENYVCTVASFQIIFLVLICCVLGNMDPPKWVGASRESTPRSPYYWVNHQRLINGLWAAGEPNYNNPEPACAYSYKDKAKLYDAPCGNHNGYTCQKCKNFISPVLP